MRKIVYIIMAIVAFSTLATSCNKGKTEAEQKNDSLSEVVEDKEGEIAELEALLQQVEDGFGEIAQAENRIMLERNRGEGNKSQAIQENLQFIKESLAEKQQTIDELQSRLESLRANSSADKKKYESLIAGYEKRINDFKEQVQGFQVYIADLESQLAAKDQTIAEQSANIAEQKAEIAEKQTTISEQSAELDSRARTISTQDKALHTAYYVYGTKKELKNENILKDGDVLKQGNFNKSYFTEIDIRMTKSIPLNSKSAELKTSHPAGSYTLEKGADKKYTLRIVDPDKFWSTSKYLVILVK